MRERGLAGIEHRQQCLGELAGGPVDLVGVLRGDTLAVVLEVGLDAHRHVLHRVALGEQRFDVVLDRGCGRIDVGVDRSRRGTGPRRLAGEVVDLAAAFVLEVASIVVER